LVEKVCGGHPHTPGKALRPCTPLGFTLQNHGGHVLECLGRPIGPHFLFRTIVGCDAGLQRIRTQPDDN
jgi:hypothetical protein